MLFYEEVDKSAAREAGLLPGAGSSGGHAPLSPMPEGDKLAQLQVMVNSNCFVILLGSTYNMQKLHNPTSDIFGPFHDFCLNKNCLNKYDRERVVVG